MLTATRNGYMVRHVEQSPTVPCPCGQSTRIVTRADTPACNLHVTFIQDSVRHYHKNCTEVYFVLDGKGSMEIDGEVVEVRPGTVIYIDPGTRHRLESKDGVHTIVFGIPALDPADEFFD